MQKGENVLVGVLAGIAGTMCAVDGCLWDRWYVPPIKARASWSIARPDWPEPGDDDWREIIPPRVGDSGHSGWMCVP